ncbi:MAG: MltA domain-containing protein [Pseudomonadota bacterium]
MSGAADTTAFRFSAVGWRELDGWDDCAFDDFSVAFGTTRHLLPEYWQDFSTALDSVRAGDVSIRQLIEEHLQPWHVLPETQSAIALTGYFEPEFDGSLKPTPEFQVPLFRTPDDLIVPDPSLRASAGDAPLAVRRNANGSRSTYPTRPEIEGGALSGRGLELVYLRDDLDAFVLHVQGSGVVRLRSGNRQRVTFAAKNGHPYRSVGQELIRRGVLSADGMTLDAMIAWLRLQTDAVRQNLLWHNPSFIFFDLIDSDHAIGAAGTPLHPLRSMAVDPKTHPLGTPVFVVAPEMLTVDGAGTRGFNRLMISHDAGSAIRGPVRGDVFFGTGAEVGLKAGAVRHAATFYALRPKAWRPSDAENQH